MNLLIPSFDILAGVIFSLALMMNLARKNTTLVLLYLLQSLGVAIGLVVLAYAEGSQGLLFAAFLTLAVKVVMAPLFVSRMIRNYKLHVSAASYLSTPLTLLCLAVITAFSYSLISGHIGNFRHPEGIPLLFASILCVLFLMMNRRGTLSTIVGVLSLENVVIFLSAQLGLENSLALEFAISFDIAVWTVIATGFLSMIYQEFGTVDTATHMTHLTEE